jgi:hypothetical protein
MDYTSVGHFPMALAKFPNKANGLAGSPSLGDFHGNNFCTIQQVVGIGWRKQPCTIFGAKCCHKHSESTGIVVSWQRDSPQFEHKISFDLKVIKRTL